MNYAFFVCVCLELELQKYRPEIPTSPSYMTWETLGDPPREFGFAHYTTYRDDDDIIRRDHWTTFMNARTTCSDL